MVDWKAFVLMPFDDDFDPVYSQLIEPALSEAGFVVTRADLSINQQQILKDIVNQLADADLVVVDVTGLNGNVMYELGLAHAMGRRTVMITRDISELPFDLQSYRANAYSTEFTEAPKLKSVLSEIAKGVIQGTVQFSNPVQDFAPDFLGKPEQVRTATRVANQGATGDDESQADGPPADADADEEDDSAEPGLLDYLVQLSEGNELLLEIAGRVGEATAEVGNRVEKRSAQLGQVTKNLCDKAAPVLRMRLRETAGDFDAYSEELNAQNPLLRDTLVRVAESVNGLARTRSIDSAEEIDRLVEEIRSIEEAEEGFVSAYDSISGFARTLSELPSMEQNLNRSVKRAIRSINETAQIIEVGRSEFARARGVMEERLTDGALESELSGE